MTRRAGPVVAALALALLAAACSDTDPPGALVTQAPASPTSGAAVTAPATTRASAAATAPTATTAAPTTTVGVRPTPTVAPTPPPATTSPGSPTTAAAAGLAGFDFGTFAHDLGDGLVVSLRDGTFQRGSQPTDPDYVVALLRDVSVGDIDGDGADEAAVEVYWTTGGTGQFLDVLVYEWDGRAPVLAARAGTGDRALDGIRRSFVEGGELVIERFQGTAACCPERIARTRSVLAGTALRPVGATRTWAIVTIDGPDTPVRFLPGTNGAYLAGEVAVDRRGSLGARAGQTLTLDVRRGLRSEPEVVVDVLQGEAVLGTAAPGAPLTLRLPTTGGYAVVARTRASSAVGGYLDAELSIT